MPPGLFLVWDDEFAGDGCVLNLNVALDKFYDGSKLLIKALNEAHLPELRNAS